jgi:hypothetical protein
MLLSIRFLAKIRLLTSKYKYNNFISFIFFEKITYKTAHFTI